MKVSRDVLITIALLACSMCAIAGKIEDYHAKMIGRGESMYPSLDARRKIGGASVFLVAGDIFSFVRDSSGAKSDFPVDALIISTNVDLDWNSDNPRIQRQLRDLLPKNSFQIVASKFKEKKTLGPVTEPLVVDLGATSPSPRYLCFLATDLANGGTYNSDEWQVFLKFENIGEGVKNCLLALGPVKTVVVPLIGASINPSVEKVNYVSDNTLRAEHISRRVRSLMGIVKGIKDASPKSGEIGIIVWEKDISVIIDPKLRDGRKYENYSKPATYWDLRKQFLAVMNDQ
ncbi:hypothetical protein [Accumulibacter sp.]|jgi:hypothetical protein|uniref:hypothetical protein n=1 Tax=Accumulibacter sp. TaxID=2053492 RepID=UPI001AC2B804|nr:hypothetical protein [Accumulibacter sp.]MBN8454777.1 hypothetical protein [Accumulibacter sp.]